MSSRKLVIILNGISRRKKKFYQEILPGLQSNFEIELIETKHRDHAIELAQQAVDLNPHGIFAAGGDGTMNQVLNGVMSSATGQKPAIGIIPLGTGNDFSKLNKIDSTAESIINKINQGANATDVGIIKCLNANGESTVRYFINVSSLGMGPEVVKRLFKSSRALGPTFTYAKASIETFFSHKPQPIEIKSDDWNWRGKLRVLAIANGKSFGGGLFVAPDAVVDDGLFSTFVVGEIPLIKFLLYLYQIKAAKRINDKLLHYNTCKSLTLTSPIETWIETEGELAGILPATVEIIPGGIQFFR